MLKCGMKGWRPVELAHLSVVAAFRENGTQRLGVTALLPCMDQPINDVVMYRGYYACVMSPCTD